MHAPHSMLTSCMRCIITLQHHARLDTFVCLNSSIQNIHTPSFPVRSIKVRGQTLEVDAKQELDD